MNGIWVDRFLQLLANGETWQMLTSAKVAERQ